MPENKYPTWIAFEAFGDALRMVKSESDAKKRQRLEENTRTTAAAAAARWRTTKIIV